MKLWHKIIATFFLFATSVQLYAQVQEKKQPNILWVTFEDSDPSLGAYGDTLAKTPHMDALAQKGFRFTQAWANAPVCAPSRTTLITGQYATTLGAEQMRSSVAMDPNEKLLPELLAQEGYYTSNHHKEDYNVALHHSAWHESNKKAHWRKRGANQAFFSVFNLGKSHESGLWSNVDISQYELAAIKLPPYYPDLPEIRRAIAAQYANLEVVDADLGRILSELEADGLSENTIIFVFSDHGSGMPRHKRWLYPAGLKVPMIAYFPEKWKHLAENFHKEGSLTNDTLVSFVDMAPTMLSLVNAKIPEYMQGIPFAGPAKKTSRHFAHGFRGRMDEVYDLSRSITDGRYLYIRNYMAEIAQGELTSYQKQNPAVLAWQHAFASGQLNEVQSAFWKPKSYEEFYDLALDPHAIDNLAPVTAHPMLGKLRAEMDKHLIASRDQGFIPESWRQTNSKGAALKPFFSTDSNYPVQEVLNTATAASAMQFLEVLPFRAALENQHPLIQYWATIGLVRRLDPEKDQEALLDLFKESERDTKLILASELLKGKNPQARKLAIEALLAFAAAPDEDYFAAFDALDRLKKVDPKELPWDKIEAFATLQANFPQRISDYYPRHLKALLALKPAL